MPPCPPYDDQPVKTWKLPAGRITSLALTADATKLVSGGEAMQEYRTGSSNLIGTMDSDWVRLWDAQSGAFAQLSFRAAQVAVASDGRFIAAAGPIVDIRRTPQGTAYNGADRLVIYDMVQIELRNWSASWTGCANS